MGKIQDIKDKLNNTDYHVDEEIYVSGLSDLEDAINKRYGEIYLQGELQKKLADKVENTKAANMLGNVLLIDGLLAWPFLLFGGAAKVAGSGGYKHYKPVTLKVKGHRQTFKIVLKESEKKRIRRHIENVKFKTS